MLRLPGLMRRIMDLGINKISLDTDLKKSMILIQIKK